MAWGNSALDYLDTEDFRKRWLLRALSLVSSVAVTCRPRSAKTRTSSGLSATSPRYYLIRQFKSLRRMLLCWTKWRSRPQIHFCLSRCCSISSMPFTLMPAWIGEIRFFLLMFMLSLLLVLPVVRCVELNNGMAWLNGTEVVRLLTNYGTLYCVYIIILYNFCVV